MNILISLPIIAFIGILIWWQDVFNSKEANAALVGALIGALAIFLGNAINGFTERRDKSLVKKNVKTAIMSELVRICPDLMASAKYFRSTADHLANGQAPGYIPFISYMPRDDFVFKTLLSNSILLLTDIEIDKLGTFYGNLQITRQLLAEASSSTGSLLVVEPIAKSFEHDCSVAAEVVEALAPGRKIQMPGDKPKLLTQLLKEAAGV
jgi:hypothetical protein